MEHGIAAIQQHGVLALCAVVFLKRMGVPIPALPFLLLAGAQAAGRPGFGLLVLVAATGASAVADGAWFFAGRRYGGGMLGLMCRVSLSPDSCIRKSERVFARRGAQTVLLAKFIPGVAGLAPPFAGALGMKPATFMGLNLAGTALWTGTGIGLGLAFHASVQDLLGRLQEMGNAAVPAVALACGLYVAWRVARRLWTGMHLRTAPRIRADELARLIAGGVPVVLLDVRGEGPLLRGRIPGAMPLGDEAFDPVKAWPAGAQLVTYCDCPNEASAARIALRLRKQGHAVRVLAGGVAAWEAAGHPLEARRTH